MSAREGIGSYVSEFRVDMYDAMFTEIMHSAVLDHTYAKWHVLCDILQTRDLRI